MTRPVACPGKETATITVCHAVSLHSWRSLDVFFPHLSDLEVLWFYILHIDLWFIWVRNVMSVCTYLFLFGFTNRNSRCSFVVCEALYWPYPISSLASKASQCVCSCLCLALCARPCTHVPPSTPTLLSCHFFLAFCLGSKYHEFSTFVALLDLVDDGRHLTFHTKLSNLFANR